MTGSFWGHLRSRHWISSESRVAPLVASLTLIKLFGLNTRVRFSLTLKSSPCHRADLRAERYGCHRFDVAELLAKKSICSEGRHTKDFSLILNSVPETLPRMLRKHAAKEGGSPTMRRAKSERLSGILSLSLFLVRGRVSIETHAFFHLTKRPFFDRLHHDRRCPTSGFGNRMTFSNNPESSACSGEVATKTTEFWTGMADYRIDLIRNYCLGS